MKKVIYFIALIVLFSACKKNSDSTSQGNTNPPPTFVSYFSDTSSTKPLGLIASTEAERQNIPWVEDLDSTIFPNFAKVASLPSSWSISVPDAGNQNPYESCVGWSVGYGLLSYQYKIINNYSDYSLDRIFSPAFIWNKLNKGFNQGIKFPDALNLVKNQGCCRWPYMPADAQSVTAQPTAEAITNAAEFKIMDYMQMHSNDVNKIKLFLYRNYPIPFGAKIDQGFESGNYKPSYEKKPDGRLVWTRNQGLYEGNHAMLICGYDDDINAFKVLNSWGKNWGNEGYIWIDYGFFKTIVNEIYVVITRRPNTYFSIPVVKSLPITSITSTTASGGGIISSDGGSTVTINGVCWSSSPYPTVSDSTTKDLAGVGQFTSSINSLIPNRTYYLRAYGTNSTGTGYGNEISFTTTTPVATIPTITTSAITGITQTIAQSGGSITSDGNATVTTRGVCWSTTSNPTIANNKTIDGSGIGSFTSSLTGLNATTTYYVSAYATNSVGTGYGNEIAFTTTGTGTGNTVTDIDGNVYNTVQIGTQIWMKENLKTSHYRDGSAIPQVQSASTGEGAWYTQYPDDSFNTVYGKLYNYYAVDDVRGLAPPGWHVPSDAEWTTLITFLGGDSVAGGKMKSTTLWTNPNTGATNSSGFTGLPAGIYYYFNSWDTYGYWGYWWSSDVWYRILYYDFENVTRTFSNKGDALSVRCIKD